MIFSFIHSFISSSIHIFISSFNYLFIRSLTHSHLLGLLFSFFTYLFSYSCLIYFLIYSFTHLLIFSLIHSFIHSLTHSIIVQDCVMVGVVTLTTAPPTCPAPPPDTDPAEVGNRAQTPRPQSRTESSGGGGSLLGKNIKLNHLRIQIRPLLQMGQILQYIYQFSIQIIFFFCQH